MNELPVTIPQCELTKTSATFPPSMDWQSWVNAGLQLGKIGACANWWIGDWLVYGRMKFCERNENGTYKKPEKYIMAEDATGLDGQTLQNAAWVGSSIPLSLRREGLTWTHHREVAQLNESEQASWLGKAEENKWSVSDLRRAIRTSNATETETPIDMGWGFEVTAATLEHVRVCKVLIREHGDPSSWPEPIKAEQRRHLDWLEVNVRSKL